MGIGVASISRLARRGRGGLLLAVLALGLILGAGRAHAQAVKGQIISVGIGGVNGQNGVYREGSWIPVQVRIRNMTGQPFVGHLAVDQDQIDLDGDKVLSIGPEFTLAPGVDERTLWTYYWPRPDYTNLNRGITKVVVLDKAGAVVPDSTLSTPGGQALAVDIGPVDSAGSHHSTRMVVVLGRNLGGWRSFEGMYGGTEAICTVQINSASQLPDRVLGYDGVDVIYWQADSVKLADLSPPEFTLTPMLEWVKSGGHLIISVASPEQAQAFAKADEKFRALLPLALTGTRDITTTDVGVLGAWGVSLRDPARPAATLVQSIGTLRPGGGGAAAARVVIGDAPGPGALFADHPLVVTGLCGRGAITMITVDPSDQEFLQRLNDRQWIAFWNQTVGWRQNDFANNFITQLEYNNQRNLDAAALDARISMSPLPIRLGDSVEQEIDVRDVTAVRILVALLFLALYWLLAGPVGHLLLRAYKVVHWSWWVFGGIVILATGVAGMVVLVLHVSNYEVRHQSFVLGTVTSPDAAANADATVTSFYGIYAPVSGLVPVTQPETAGLNYLAPLCLPSSNDVKSFADPQSYTLRVDQTASLSPVFRNTLKKLQARWNGPLPGITGSAQYAADSSDLRHILAGTLTNKSGYDLHDPDVLVYLPRVSRGVDIEGMDHGSTYLYHLAGAFWKNGETIDLQTSLNLDLLGQQSGAGARVGTIEMALEVIGWQMAKPVNYGYGYFDKGLMKPDDQLKALASRTWRPDLLYLLADARNNDDLAAGDRRELDRGIGRMTDCTKALHAAGALIVAHAEDVKSPVTLNVNGHPVEGKGSVLFAWALPVAGTQPPSVGLPAAAARAGAAGAKPLLPDIKPEVP